MESNYAASGLLDRGFCDILDDYFMSQLCLLPTRGKNILDLLITNLPELVSISEVCHRLIHSDTECDLGITITSKLLWKDQVEKVRFKANKLLGMLRRSTTEMTDIQARRSLYLQLVRSNFAFASQVWCPQSVELINDIEKVQRRATKFILFYFKSWVFNRRSLLIQTQRS